MDKNFWYGCRGCGWLSKINEVGHMTTLHRQYNQSCDYPNGSLFNGTEQDYRDLILKSNN